MNCIYCNAPTALGKGYALPFLIRTPTGAIQNLYACSRECRAAWLDARKQVQAIQKEIKQAQTHMEVLADE
ncbi:MAG: hypothetical protein HDKAJFGB_01818 [Anaerolineae bacterium]|nr:hypothetical protein [Anaerolineae bacterium]RIK17613.1 MAG: hypothetical protein DCC52_16755 [Chloroflexota bacterium]